MDWLRQHVELVLSVVGILLHGGAVLGVLLSRRRDPSATLAWLLFLVLAPVVGLVAYIVLGRTRMSRALRRSAWAEERLAGVLARHGVMARIGAADEPGAAAPLAEVRGASLLALGTALSSTPASRCNRVRVLRDAAATYSDILSAIEAAQDHVHVQFYIVQDDAVGRALRERLAACAARGVEVRMLVDGVGSFSLPSDFWRPLEEAGGRAGAFHPVRWRFRLPARRDRVDFRNHRKVVVVDGRTGFTGGINVGREYLGLDPDIGHWRDTHLRIDGPAALSLQHAFAQDWVASTDEVLEDERYFPDVRDGVCGRATVQIIDSGPDRRWRSMALVHAQAIALATDRVWITNPYFIPSPTLLDALTAASLRGVDVRLLLPAKSDNRLVELASHSYYQDVLRAGVRVFEYGRGFLHAKTMLVDDWMGTVGSANMDLRSFNLNFELNAFVFDDEVPKTLAAQFAQDLASATEATLDRELSLGLVPRLTRGFARLLSPLL